MAVILDLSNELIMLIASNIRKPSEILEFALAHKRIHGMVIKRLYEDITFDRHDYPAFVIPKAFNFDTDDSQDIMRMNYDAPNSNMLRLAHMIRTNAVPAGQTITRLTIDVGINSKLNRFQTTLSLLLPQLSSLMHLSLTTVSEDRLAWQHEPFSLAPVTPALSASAHSLKSLDMHFFLHSKNQDGWTIGSLRHFSNLEFLSVQGDVLLGQYGQPAACMPSLDSLLPLGLKVLRLHWGTVHELDSLFTLFGLKTLLADFVDDSVGVSRKTEAVIVQLNAKARSPADQDLGDGLGGSLLAMNEKARSGGLDLKITLEWRKDYQWSKPVASEGTFREKHNHLRKMVAKHKDLDFARSS